MKALLSALGSVEPFIVGPAGTLKTRATQSGLKETFIGANTDPLLISFVMHAIL